MKITNIALHAVLAVIGTASRASAKGFIRGSVEEREDVRRETMGDHVAVTQLNKCADGTGSCEIDKTCGGLISTAMGGSMPTEKNGLFDIASDMNYMKACTEVSKANDACVGCQGYELEEGAPGEALTDGGTNGMIHIPGCVNMSVGECQAYARDILDKHPGWFPDGVRGNFKLDLRQVTSTHNMLYFGLAIPVKGGVSGDTESAMGQKVEGLAKDSCMVHYPWTWCLDPGTGNVQCNLLNPFDCSNNEGDYQSGCLSAGECCARIQGEKDGMARYQFPDINGNKLQCYAWPIDTPAETVPTTVPGTVTPPTSEGGNGGNNDGTKGPATIRLIIHINRKRVALPAIITARNDFVVEGDGGYAPVYEEDNLNKWENGEPVSTESIEMAKVNNAVYFEHAAEKVLKGTGYSPGNTNYGEVLTEAEITAAKATFETLTAAQ